MDVRSRGSRGARRLAAVRRTYTDKWVLAGVLLSVLSLLTGQPARAESSASLVLEGNLREGRGIVDNYQVLVDPDGALTLEDVRAAAFEPASGVASYGFTRATYWFRVRVRNPSSEPVPWFLEIGYPHLDHVELFSPEMGGSYRRSETGDRLPFANREVDHRNFVFRLETRPGDDVYYLRVSSSGPLNVPLMAWSPDGFMESLGPRYAVLWMFYGLMLAMIAYNLFIYVSVRDRGYIVYVGYIAAYVLFQFSLNGLSFQYLLPESPDMANRLVPTSIGFAFLCGVHFSRLYIESPKHTPRWDRVPRWTATFGGGTAMLLAQLTPVWFSLRVAVVFGLVSVFSLLPVAVLLAVRGHRQARYYVVAWTVLLAGILMYLLKSLGVIPSNSLTEWTIQIGAAIEVLLLSLGLADRINIMRRDLGKLNHELEGNVEQLSTALANAEEARKAKSIFLASVSHELRTPLNAIINIPEGLLEDFQDVRAARCGTCHAMFELDEGEQLAENTPCPDCSAADLTPIQTLAFHGDANQTKTHLQHVQRAGAHLLQVVSDILDVSKLEAGRMTVTLGRESLSKLVEDALEPMRTFAAGEGVTLRFESSESAMPVLADPVKLQQVLINLVGNAIKFSDGKGVVQVDLRDDGEAFTVGVHDEGVGIAEQDLGELFQPFVQAKRSGNRRFGGTGLGLAISKLLVDAHGGEIWVESEVGRGSKFFVRLPRARTDSQPTTRVASLEPPAAEGAA